MNLTFSLLQRFGLAAIRMKQMLRYIDKLDRYSYFKKIIVNNLNLRQTSLMCIFRHADRKVGFSYYSNKKLAEKCNISLYSIQKDIIKLRKLGLIYANTWHPATNVNNIFNSTRHIITPWGCERYWDIWVNENHPRFGKRKRPIPKEAIDKLDAYIKMVQLLKEPYVRK